MTGGPPATRSRLDNRAPTRLMRRWRSAVASRQLIPIDRYDWLTTIVRGNAAAGVVCVRRSGPFRGPGRVQWLPPTGPNIAQALVTIPPGFQLWKGPSYNQ